MLAGRNPARRLSSYDRRGPSPGVVPRRHFMFGGKRVLWAVALLAIAFSTTAASVGRSEPAAAQLDRTVSANAGLSLGFVANRGQADPRTRFYAQGDRYAFSATRDSLLLSFVKAKRARGVT